MSSGQWEVVGKNKKDKLSGQTNKKPDKADKKKTVPTPKVEDILPLSQVKNIYSNMGKGNKENKKPQEKENKPKEVPKKQPAKKTEKSQEPKPKPPKSIESALNTINVDDFKSSLETSKQRFPDAPLVWLKELAAFLNAKVSLEVNDPVFTTKPDGYPLNATPVGVKQVMEKVLQEAGKANVQLFFDISLTAMANDMSKGLPALGHKLWLQYIAFHNPQVTATHLEKYISLKTSYQNRQPIGLSLFWALGQGGVKDFNIGLKVFKEYMLPSLDMKNYARFVVKYLSQLLNRHENVTLSKDNYTFLLDVINTKRSLPNEVSQELNGLSKKLKAMFESKSADKKYSAFFEPALAKLTTNASATLKKEMSETLVVSLAQDATCYSTWRQLYGKQYQQSCVLIKYIHNNWKKVSNQLDKKQLKELLHAFLNTNKDLLSKSKKDVNLQESNKICKALLDKMTVSKSFPWKFFSFVLILAAASFLAYDFNKHGSWKKTQSVKTLKEIGVWEYGEKALGKAHIGLNWTRERIEEYAPGYIDATSEVLHPYVELARDMGIIVYNAGEKLSKEAMKKVPVVVESVEKYAPGLIQQVEGAWHTTANVTVEYWNKGYKYVTTEVFVGQLAPENMQKVLANAFDTSQKYAVEYYNWVYQKVQSTVQGK